MTRPSRRLERMIEIGMIAATAKPDADKPVGGQKERTPAFELADVDHLVTSAAGEAIGVSGEDDVPERHRGAAVMERAAAEKASDQSAVDFDDAVPQSDRTAGHCCEKCKRQADHRDGKRPEVADKSH
jgi:hypothetical protein